MFYPPTQPNSPGYPLLPGVGGIPAAPALPPHVQQLFYLIASFWSQGYTREQIIASCSEELNRELYDYALIVLDYLETHSPPTEAQQYRYREEIAAIYRMNPSPLAMRELEAKTKNIYLKDLARQAAEVLENAAAQGRLPGKNGKPGMTLADPIQIVLQEQVSVFLFGNSGSGKSSVAVKLASAFTHHVQATTGEDVQILVLDPHLNDWGNLAMIDSQLAILRTQDLLVRELIRRREDWRRQVRTLPPEQRRKDWPFLIVIWDEVDDAMTFADSQIGKQIIKDEELFHPSDSLRLLGSQIRKFQGMLIALNQSGNCDALGLDSKYRSNYIDFHLGESALMQAAQWKADSPERLFIESRRAGYPCVVRNRPAMHPTHGQYPIRAKNLPPSVCEQPIFSPWSMPLPEQPIVFRGRIEEAFCGKVLGGDEDTTAALPQEQSLDEEDELDDPWLNNAQTDRRQAFRDIKRGRTATPPKSKTQICEGWSGKTEEKFALYDEAVETYGDSWIKEYVQDGKLTQPWQDLVTLIWGIPRNRNHRKKFYAYKRIFARIMDKLGIKEWETSSPTNQTQQPSHKHSNVIPFRKHIP